MSERIGQMAVRHQYQDVSKRRGYAYAAVSLSGASDFARVGVVFIGDNFAVGEAEEVVDERISSIARQIDAVVRNCFQRRVGWRHEVPIELHLHAARPLDDRIYANGVFEWLNEDFRTV